MTADEARLYAEMLPDGTFGGPRPARVPGPDPEAAAHYAVLEAAVCRRRPRTPARQERTPV